MEDDGLGLHLPVLDVHFVATQDDGDVLTHAHQVSMPVRHVLVSDSRGDIEHDDSTLGWRVDLEISPFPGISTRRGNNRTMTLNSWPQVSQVSPFRASQC